MLGAETDGEMKDLIRAELETQEARRTELEAELKELLIPKDQNDGKNVIVEIRGAEGGDEANIWAGDLYRMYQHYAEQHRWKLEQLSGAVSDMGGFRDVTFVVKGKDAWRSEERRVGKECGCRRGRDV